MLHASRRFGATAAVLMAALLAGCGTNTGAVHEISVNGAQLMGSVDTVYADACTRFVDLASSDIWSVREDLRRAGRVDEDFLDEKVQARAASNREFCDAMATAQEHAKLLGAYFVALGQLADPGLREQAAASANSLADQLFALAPEVKELSLGGLAVSSLIKPAIDLGVGQFQARELQAHFDAHAAEIDDSLATQVAMLAVLDQQYRDEQCMASAVQFDSVWRRFIALDSSLSREEFDREYRKAELCRELVGMVPTGEALSAARSLQTTYRQVAAGELDLQSGLAQANATLQLLLQLYRQQQQMPTPGG
jgi:hypothetical protein